MRMHLWTLRSICAHLVMPISTDDAMQSGCGSLIVGRMRMEVCACCHSGPALEVGNAVCRACGLPR